MSESKETIRKVGASPLVGRLKKNAHVREIAERLAGGAKRVHVSGLRGSSISFLAEALREMLGRVVLVCCASEEDAEDLTSDFQTISGANVLMFPGNDSLPKGMQMGEKISTRGERNHCLDRIWHGGVDVVVTSIYGFFGKTISVETLLENRRIITLKKSLDLEEIREHLVSMGYEQAAIVEEAGQFALRGAILDIFDPSWENPARVELLDDEIISIRAFDIDSQSSIKNLEEVVILPASCVLLDSESLGGLRERLLRARLSKEKIEEVEHDVAQGRHSYLLRRYSPAMGMNRALLDFFRQPPLIVFAGVEKLRGSFERLEEKGKGVLGRVGDSYPFLDFHEYFNRFDYHTSYDFPCLHLWEASASGGRGKRITEGPMASRNSSPSTTDGVSTRRYHWPPSEEVFPFNCEPHPDVLGKIDVLAKTLLKLREKGVDVFIYSETPVQRERLADMLEDVEPMVHLPVGWITAGFVWNDVALAVLTDHEIFRRLIPRPVRKRGKKRIRVVRHDHLQVGDFVVHVDYGIGRFVGLEKVSVEGRESEYLSVRYSGGGRVFVPIEQMHLVEKYVGKEGVVPTLDRLGTSKWQKTKERTKKALREVARELLEIYAEREVAEGHTFSQDTPWQRELEAAFPFEETPHQLRATEELKRDMESPRPMDRLVCGDVGYGKTEVAIRAAFKAVCDSKQVAVLVPTTILAMQHFKTFRERLGALPVKVEMLSRLRSAAEQRKVVESLKRGSVDIVIGTHRLLSRDVAFRDLGLLIIDEEHRFGVRNKEKLKSLKKSVDVLTLTATPIPRTLYMALSGLRRISLIDTPPRNRHPVKTQVVPFDERIITQAIEEEIGRGGQVFFVHNRIASIYSLRAFLEKLVPRARFGVAHGQMGEHELERVVLSFLAGEFDVLISTTIIEAGLDFPNVNTIIINRADRFGLAQLYQLRGRVGRREKQAYAYLLLQRSVSFTEAARKRLQAMEEFEELGSGYRLAMRDLEIRGAGNVLGVEQHGHIVAVGFDLYCRMLREAVESLKGKPREEKPLCRIESTLESYLPAWYVEDQNERMEFYKRLANPSGVSELEALEDEMRDRFGDPPPEASSLIELARIKLLGMELGVGRIRLESRNVLVEFPAGRSFSHRQCAALAETFSGRVLFKSGENFSVLLNADSEGSVLMDSRNMLQAAFFYDKRGFSPE